MSAFRPTFVSYADADSALCASYVAALRARGIDVWYERNQAAGQLLSTEVYREIQSRAAFILLLTPAALDSIRVQLELQAYLGLMAQDHSRILLPVRIGASPIPPSLSALPWIDAQTLPFEQVINTLATALTLPSAAYSQTYSPTLLPPAGPQWGPLTMSHADGYAMAARRSQKMPMTAIIVSIVALIGVVCTLTLGTVFYMRTHMLFAGAPVTTRNTTPRVPSTLHIEVSESEFAAIGTGQLANPFHATHDGSPIARADDGKPLFLYVGADYCPYCAVERWSLVVALNRFGAFQNLTLIQSSSTDAYPNTSTFSFHGASYTSQYLDFQGIEVQDRDGQPLDQLTSAQQAIFDKYDAPPYIDSQYAGSIPFLSVGNQYIEISAGFTPDQMQGLTWQQIADQLSDPNNTLTRNIVANANYITAAICQVTDNKPTNVCTAAPIPQIIKNMKAGR